MKQLIYLLIALFMAFDTTLLASSTYTPYGYCSSCQNDPCECEQPVLPACEPCNRYAPVCGTECGLSVCSIAAAVAAVVGVAAIIITTSQGGSSVHSANS